MHPSTEDLLTIRDGEPLGAAERAAIEARPMALREVERLRAVQRGLRALPDLEPPPGVWERVVAAEHERRFAPRRWLRGLAGLGVAAAVAGVAIIYLAQEPAVPEWTAAVPSTVVVPGGRGTREAPYVAPLPASYTVLVEESARLEKLLAQMPSPRPLMAGSTATTIVGLEDRIAFLDEQLSYGAARGLQMPQREALWSERVELMNALVHVRFAQAQGNGF
jgi:hypothetical protein